ncbi:MAG: flagellar motor protein MotD [Nitrosomonas sp.]|nr:flagellar motor protein MotD [Nitrosomonas sp.]MCP5250772.1 flagellar motor protein MotD [Burkholderiales bacterium]HQU61582.1 flagellar motor protein MotD [Nitrosomonas sp.]
MTRRRLFNDNETHENHERWLVSYADFITLLFAFFVVMYATSSLNEGKYKILSNSLVSAFKSTSSQTGTDEARIPVSLIKTEPDGAMIKIMEKENGETRQAERIERKETMQSMAKDILRALSPLIEDGSVTVTQSAIGITVEINASVLFSPGEAFLAENSIEALRAVATVIQEHNHEIHVEGHTDNIPIQTVNFPSNWELSTARASSVIRLFIENGVDAARLTAIGYGENRPVDSNETSEGRKRNRRVSIMILANDADPGEEIPIMSD